MTREEIEPGVVVKTFRSWKNGEVHTRVESVTVDGRPLIVLDLSPHDVFRALEALRGSRGMVAMDVAARLERAAKKAARAPKPEEPRKHGVVLAGDGREWSRWTTSERDGYDWVRPSRLGETKYARWEDLDVVRVLSEGVTP